MDQVKEYLAVALKHAFWIGSSVVLIVSLLIWFLTTSDLNDQTDKQISAINADVNKVRDFRMELPTQPNDLSHARMDQLIENRTDEVLEAWKVVFDAQRKILTWPEILKDDFVNEFKYVKDPETGEFTDQLKLPFEKYELHGEDVDGDAKLNPQLLRRYERYIGTVLPNYAKIGGAKWTADFEKKGAGMMGGLMGGGDGGYEDSMMGGAMMGGGMGRPGSQVDISGARKEPVVKWSTGSQESLLKDLFPWRGRKPYPSELEVYYSQENLWILQQMLEIIAAVNGDAAQAFEAEIREIKDLSIGSSVKFDAGTLTKPGAKASGMGGMGGMGGDYGDMMGGMEGGGMDGDMYGGDMYSSDMGGGGGSAEEELGADPGDNRYVNTAFEPIEAATLRSAFASNSPGDVAIAVAKRIPVKMHLQMDQRSIPKLLAACGSAPLMIDVHQVRIMPKGGSSGSAGGEYGGDMMGSMEGEFGGMGAMGGGMGGSTASAEEFPMDMDVEIYGLIYFYNPYSEEALGIEKVDEETTIDATAETVDGALPNPTPPEPPATGTPATGTPATGTPATVDPATPETGATATPPAASDPAAGQPAGNDPATTDPAETDPSEAAPAGAAPAEAAPAGATPAGTAPADTTTAAPGNPAAVATP